MAVRYGSAVLMIGLLAERPPAGKLDRAVIYYATDTAAVYFYDPAAQTWTIFAGGGVGGYNLIQNQGAPLPAETTLDVEGGTFLVATDDPGNTRTKLTTSTIDKIPGSITESQHGSLSAGTDHAAMVGSGASHKPGFVPDPGASAGTVKFLREDASWQIPGGAGPIPFGFTNYIIGPSIATPGSYSAWAWGSATELFTSADGRVVLQAVNDALKAIGHGGSCGVLGYLPCSTGGFIWDCPAFSILGTGWVKTSNEPTTSGQSRIRYTGGVLHSPFIQVKGTDCQLLDIMVDGNSQADTTLRIGNADNSANRFVGNNAACVNGRVDTCLWESADGEWEGGEFRSAGGAGGDPERYLLHTDGANINVIGAHLHGIGAAANNGRVVLNTGQNNLFAGCHVEGGGGNDGQWLIETQSQKWTWTGGKWGYIEQGGHLLVSTSSGGATVAGVQCLPQGLLNDNTYTEIQINASGKLVLAGLDTFQNFLTPDNFFKQFISIDPAAEYVNLSAINAFCYRPWDSVPPTTYSSFAYTRPIPHVPPDGTFTAEVVVL